MGGHILFGRIRPALIFLLASTLFMVTIPAMATPPAPHASGAPRASTAAPAIGSYQELYDYAWPILSANQAVLQSNHQWKAWVRIYLQRARFEMLTPTAREQLRAYGLSNYERFKSSHPELARAMALIVTAVDREEAHGLFDAQLKIGEKPSYDPAQATELLDREIAARGSLAAGDHRDKIDHLVDLVLGDYGRLPSRIRTALYTMPQAQLDKVWDLYTNDKHGFEKIIVDTRLATDPSVTESAYRRGVKFALEVIAPTAPNRAALVAANRRLACDALRDLDTRLASHDAGVGLYRESLGHLFGEYYSRRRGTGLAAEMGIRSGETDYPMAEIRWDDVVVLRRYLMEECLGLFPTLGLADGSAAKNRPRPELYPNPYAIDLVKALTAEARLHIHYFEEQPNIRGLLPVEYLQTRLAELDREIRVYQLGASTGDYASRVLSDELARTLAHEKLVLQEKLYGARIGLPVFPPTGLALTTSAHPFSNRFDWKHASAAEIARADGMLDKLSYAELTAFKAHLNGQLSGVTPSSALAAFRARVETLRQAKEGAVRTAYDRLHSISDGHDRTPYSDLERAVSALSPEALLDVRAYAPGNGKVHLRADQALKYPPNLLEIGRRVNYDDYAHHHGYPDLTPEQLAAEWGQWDLEHVRHPGATDESRRYHLRPLYPTVENAGHEEESPEGINPREPWNGLISYFRPILSDNGRPKEGLLNLTLGFGDDPDLDALLRLRRQMMDDLKTVNAADNPSGYHPQYTGLGEPRMEGGPAYRRLLSLAIANVVRSIDRALISKKPELFPNPSALAMMDAEKYLDLLNHFAATEAAASPEAKAGVQALEHFLRTSSGVVLPLQSLQALYEAPDAVRDTLKRMTAGTHDAAMTRAISEAIFNPGLLTSTSPHWTPAQREAVNTTVLDALDAKLSALHPPFSIKGLTAPAAGREAMRQWAIAQLKAQVERSTPMQTDFRDRQTAEALALLIGFIDERGHDFGVIEGLEGGEKRHDPHVVYRAILDEEAALSHAGCSGSGPQPLACERLAHYRELLDHAGMGMPSKSRVMYTRPELDRAHFDAIGRLEAIIPHLKTAEGKRRALESFHNLLVSPSPAAVELASALWDRDYYLYLHTPYENDALRERIIQKIIEGNGAIDGIASGWIDALARSRAHELAVRRLQGTQAQSSDLTALTESLLRGDGGRDPGLRYLVERELRIKAAQRLIEQKIATLRASRRSGPQKDDPITPQDIQAMHLADDARIKAILEPVARQDEIDSVRAQLAQTHQPGTPAFQSALQQELYKPVAQGGGLKPAHATAIQERLQALTGTGESVGEAGRAAQVADFLRDHLYSCVQHLEQTGMRLPPSEVVLDSEASRQRAQTWQDEEYGLEMVDVVQLREVTKVRRAIGSLTDEAGVLRSYGEGQAEDIARMHQLGAKASDIAHDERDYRETMTKLAQTNRKLARAQLRLRMLTARSDQSAEEARVKELLAGQIATRVSSDQPFPTSDKLYPLADADEILNALLPSIRRELNHDLQGNSLATTGARKEALVHELARLRAHTLLREVEKAQRSAMLERKKDLFSRQVNAEEGTVANRRDQQYRRFAQACLNHIASQPPYGGDASLLPLQPDSPDDVKAVADAFKEFQQKREQAAALARALQAPPGIETGHLPGDPATQPLYQDLERQFTEGRSYPFRLTHAQFQAMFHQLSDEAARKRTEADHRLEAILAKLTPYGFIWDGVSLDRSRARLWEIGHSGPLKNIRELKEALEALGEFGKYAGSGSNPWKSRYPDNSGLINEIAQRYITGGYVAQFEMGNDRVEGAKVNIVEVQSGDSLKDFLNDYRHAEDYLKFKDPTVVRAAAQRDSDALQDDLRHYSDLSREVGNLANRVIYPEAIPVLHLQGELTQKRRDLRALHERINREIAALARHGHVEVKWRQPKQRADGSVDQAHTKEITALASLLSESLRHQQTHARDQAYNRLEERVVDNIDAARHFWGEFALLEAARLPLLLIPGLGEVSGVKTIAELVGAFRMGYEFQLASKVIGEWVENGAPLDFGSLPERDRVHFQWRQTLDGARRNGETFVALHGVNWLLARAGINPFIGGPAGMFGVSLAMNLTHGMDLGRSIKEAAIAAPFGFPWDQAVGMVFAKVPFIANRPWLQWTLTVPLVAGAQGSIGAAINLGEAYLGDGYYGLRGKIEGVGPILAHSYMSSAPMDWYMGFASAGRINADVLKYRLAYEPGFTIAKAHQIFGTRTASGDLRADALLTHAAKSLQVREFKDLYDRVGRLNGQGDRAEAARIGEFLRLAAQASGFTSAEEFRHWIDSYAGAHAYSISYLNLEQVGRQVRDFARGKLLEQYRSEKSKPAGERRFRDVDALLSHYLFSTGHRFSPEAFRFVPIDDLKLDKPSHLAFLRQLGQFHGIPGDRLAEFARRRYQPSYGTTGEALVNRYKAQRTAFDAELSAEASREKPLFLREKPTRSEQEAAVNGIAHRSWIYDEIKVSELVLDGTYRFKHHEDLIWRIAEVNRWDGESFLREVKKYQKTLRDQYRARVGSAFTEAGFRASGEGGTLGQLLARVKPQLDLTP